MKKRMLLLTAILMMMTTSLWAQQDKGRTEWDSGIMFLRSEEGQFETRLDMRIYLDGAYFFTNKNKMRNGTMLRRARFGVKAQLYRDWRVEFDVDLADNAVDAKDMWLSYQGLHRTLLTTGQFKAPFSLNELTSSRLLTFMERAYPNVFAIGRRAALGVTRWGDHYFVSGALFGQEFAAKEQDPVSEGGGAAARFVYFPINAKAMLVHLGGNLAYLTPDNESNAINYKIEPESKMGDTEFLDTGDITHVDHIILSDLEGAFRYKNFCVQGEYMQSQLKRQTSFKDIKFFGGYVFASWILTGETRPYKAKEGEFGQIIPENEYGAVELAVRYSHVSLSDAAAGVTGGKANNYALALNWYAKPTIRFMLNYILVNNSVYADGKNHWIGGDRFSLVQFRTLVFF